MAQKVPILKTDKEDEEFLEQDLTDYIDPRKAQRATFEFLPKGIAGKPDRRRRGLKPE